MSYNHNTERVDHSYIVDHFFTYGNTGVDIARVRERHLAEERRQRIAALRDRPDRATRIRSRLSAFLVAMGTVLLRENAAEAPAPEIKWGRTSDSNRPLDAERILSR